MFKFLLYKLGQFLVNHLPTQVSYRMACFLSDMQYRLSFRDRQAVCNNLRVILGERKDLSNITREVFRSFGVYLVDFFRMKNIINPDFLAKNIRFHNLKYLKDVEAQHKGGILLTAHLGNWEMGGVILASMGFPITAVALPHKERPVNDLFNQQREAKGITIVPISQAVRRCMETLKKNGLVALVADRDFNMHGELMDFLGKKAIIPRGPAVLSLRTGAPVIPAFLVRQPDHTFDLHVCEPIYPPADKVGHDDQETLIQLIKTYLPIIEKFIRENPSQWLMFRKFWVDE
jgi:lauroyl/myristoyl acyltransferase